MSSIFLPLFFPLQFFSLFFIVPLLILSFLGYSLFSLSCNSFSFFLSFRIIAAVRTLLSLIPINQKVLEALEVFVHPISSQGASEDTRLPPSPKAVLSEFYDAAAVSPTLLLYNLEVYIHVHIITLCTHITHCTCMYSISIIHLHTCTCTFMSL